MRVAMIVMATVMVSSPSLASDTCMTQAEARRHFGAVHLYWHGLGHCWDDTPGRHRIVQRARAKEPRVERDMPQDNKPSRWTHEPRWRRAMSEMLPENAAPLRPTARTRAGSETGSERSEMPSPGVNWRDRWVDVVQRRPPVVDKSDPADLAPPAARSAEPTATPAAVLLAILAVILTLAVIEIAFRSTIREWRR